jgi:hypothetical protein
MRERDAAVRGPDDPGEKGVGEITPRRAYEAPRIVWVEPYAPVSFGLSCAKQPGNPPCNPGPVRT